MHRDSLTPISVWPIHSQFHDQYPARSSKSAISPQSHFSTLANPEFRSRTEICVCSKQPSAETADIPIPNVGDSATRATRRETHHTSTSPALITPPPRRRALHGIGPRSPDRFPPPLRSPRILPAHGGLRPSLFRRSKRCPTHEHHRGGTGRRSAIHQSTPRTCSVKFRCDHRSAR